MNNAFSPPEPVGRHVVAQGVSPGKRWRNADGSRSGSPGRCSGLLAALLILAGTAPAQNLTVSGTVVTPRGDRGVAGATVELEELLPPHRLAERQLAGDRRLLTA